MIHKLEPKGYGEKVSTSVECDVADVAYPMLSLGKLSAKWSSGPDLSEGQDLCVTGAHAITGGVLYMVSLSPRWMRTQQSRKFQPTRPDKHQGEQNKVEYAKFVGVLNAHVKLRRERTS